MADPTAHVNSFSVRVNQQLNPVRSAVLKNSDQSVIQLILTNSIQADDVVTLSYSPGSLTAQDNGVLGAIVSESVYNILDELKLIAKIPGKIEAEDFVAMNGIQTENTSDVGGGLNVGWIDNNDWMDYQANVTAAGNYLVQFRVASASSGGQLRFMQGSKTLATVTVPVTGGWQTWTTVSASVNLNAGLQTLRIFSSKGGWNINWFDFESGTGIPRKNYPKNQFALFQNYPNPFNPITKISYSLLKSEWIKLKIYNAAGQEITMLVDEFQPAGDHHIDFDGHDFASGVYFYQLLVGDVGEICKMILIK
ncbi:carbohydrate-binding protein, partial [candidate division KSB1 bacterium]|nr:carbohydrate-binding protein [candidate division KSB1 bacterium]